MENTTVPHQDFSQQGPDQTSVPHGVLPEPPTPTQAACLSNCGLPETDDAAKGSSAVLVHMEAKDMKSNTTVTVITGTQPVPMDFGNDLPSQESGPILLGAEAQDEDTKPEPGYSGGSSIKKRTTTQSRHYRSSNLECDPESSNDTNAFGPSLARGRPENVQDSDEDEWDLPFKFMKGESSSQVESTATTSDSHGSDSFTPHEVVSSHSSHASEDFQMGGEGENSNSNDVPEISNSSSNSSDSEDSHNAQRRFFDGPGFMSSSSSSSFLVENSESSSSSSDDYLEDLDERNVLATIGESATTEVPGADTQEGSGDTSCPGSSANLRKKPGKKFPKKMLELPKVLLKQKPKQTWSAPKELLHREMGLRSSVQPQAAELFRSKFYGSLFTAERLELMKKLDGHNGCVNCLNFNYSGTKLASGSDDLTIKIWNYAVGKCLTSFHSGHKANVFQAKFVPFNGLDTVIVSCARDNQVRLTELSSSGSVCSSRKLAQHRGPAHKLSISPENPHVVLSCGEDGVVFNIDLREEKPERLVKVWEKDKKIALFSIHQNPLSPHQFCVTGKDQYVRIYDSRKLRSPTVSSTSYDDSSDGMSAGSSSNTSRPDVSPLKKFCPHHLVDSRTKTNVTAAVYNYNGDEILASYNDENIYLFNATHSDGADCTKVYEGHRNHATVKGVNFFGDRSQFVVSGSDCGNIFIWDKETESIVNFFRGDENGVVNCLEGHPTAPILATSGLDDDVKIWIPSNEHLPKMSELASTVRKNLKGREDDLKNSDMDMNGHIMWALYSHLRQARRATGEGSDSNSDSVWWRDEDEDEDTLEAVSRGVECSIT